MDDTKQSRGYVLGLFLVMNILAYIDRQLPAILMPSMRAELGLNDSQLAFITGAAFALFYVVMCMPLGRMADTMPRKKVLVICVGFWSLMTALTGFAKSFMLLAFARFGVGIGEAGLNPAAQSMLSDLYADKGKRGTASAVFSMGISLGTLIAFLGGGLLDKYFGWRMAFIVLGVPGILIAIIAHFTLQEPKRGMADSYVDTGAPPTFFETIKTMWGIRVWRYMMFGTGFAGLCNTCSTVWAPSYLSRSFNLTPAEIGAFMSPAIGLGGVVGTFFGGFMVDILRRRNPRWGALLPMFMVGSCAIPMVLIFSADSATEAILLFTYPLLIVPTHLACFSVTSQSVAPLRMRGMAPALSLLVTAGIIGQGLGPQIIGGLSDMFAPVRGEESLRYALLIVAPLAALTSAFFFYLGSRHIVADVAAAQARQGVSPTTATSVP